MHSMTGFGRAAEECDQAFIEVEIRSVNNRFLKVSSRVPSELGPYESRIEERVRRKVRRGTVNVLVRYRDREAPPVLLNEALLESYRTRLAHLQQSWGLGGDLTLDWLVTLPGVLDVEERSLDETHWERVAQLLDRALGSLLEHRQAEGARLRTEFVSGRTAIAALIEEVATRAPKIITDYRQKLIQRVEEFLRNHGVGLDESTVIREVAIFADRSDINEELARLRSHLTHLDDLLDRSGAVGRELDFLLQEMLREANTVGSKANDAELARRVVQMKAEIEKLKEQGLNIE